MPVLLESPGHAGCDERLERAEHRGATDAALATADPFVQLLGGDAAPVRGERIGNEQPLRRDPLARGVQAVGDRVDAAQWKSTAPANSEKP